MGDWPVVGISSIGPAQNRGPVIDPLSAGLSRRCSEGPNATERSAYYNSLRSSCLLQGRAPCYQVKIIVFIVTLKLATDVDDPVNLVMEALPITSDDCPMQMFCDPCPAYSPCAQWNPHVPFCPDYRYQLKPKSCITCIICREH